MNFLQIWLIGLVVIFTPLALLHWRIKREIRRRATSLKHRER